MYLGEAGLSKDIELTASERRQRDHVLTELDEQVLHFGDGGVEVFYCQIQYRRVIAAASAAAVGVGQQRETQYHHRGRHAPTDRTGCHRPRCCYGFCVPHFSCKPVLAQNYSDDCVSK